ncbi:MAG: DUF3604 domain-containing protein [Deltaproteobacteria bacterium]|nr:DUF3604 domain-containing protein [Deltaproteobacteria bacterium]
MKQLWIVACALGMLSFGCTKDSGAGACTGELCGAGGTGGTGQVICDDIDQGLRVLWGDTHVHTRLSLDSFWFNSLAGPREAYQFAKGGTVDIACDDRTVPCETRQLDRPLDFTAVSDHAEFLGLFDDQCRRDVPAQSCGFAEQTVLDNIDQFIMGMNDIDPEVILALFPDRAPRSEAWQQVITDAEAENEPCTFTTFAAYEHSPQINGSMMHRNVLFVGNDLPEDVFSLGESEDYWDLLDHLEQECGSSSDCDYITIPHSPNNSAGRMFLPVGTPGLFAGRDNQPLTPEDAALRAKADVVVEMHQAKGQSECMAGLGFDGLGNDEIDMDCFFEQNKPLCTDMPQDDPRCLPPAETVCSSITGDLNGEAVPFNCSSPNDFMRGAMAEGLKAREIVGLNPYQLGFIGSTDTHNANPSDVDETIYRGIAGALDNNPETQLGEWTCDLDDPECTDRQFERTLAFNNNPGGMAAVWATQNTREAIFEALRARRTYSTSGPRIEVRTYARFGDFPADFCDQLSRGETPVEDGDVDAVMMGALLPSGGSGAPSFAVWAAQDAGGANGGTPLERIQIIKGKLTASGEVETAVFTVAGSKDGPAPNTDCTINTVARPETLCAVWTDPNFDPSEDAYYYARILEQPTCRWNTINCLEQGVDCSALGPADGAFSEESGDAGYEGCCDITGSPGSFTGTNRFDVIRERAWTSPIWHETPLDL